jgi:hypothetical protein
VRNNVIRRCALGIANAPNRTGPIYIENNDIREGRPGYYGNVGCFKVGDNGTGTAYFTGNVCVNAVGNGWAQTNSGLNPMIARDNVINVGRYVIEFMSAVPAATSFDEDCLWTSDPTRFVKWGGTLYGSISALRTGTGQELNGTQSATCGQ